MKLNKYFSTLLGGLLLFGTWACTDKIEPESTPAYDGDDVYFSTTASTDVDIPLDATEVSVNIYRVKADGALTVNLTTSFTTEDEEGNMVSAADIFSAPASVTFPQGEKSVKIPVTVDFSKVEAGQEYYMNVKIDGDLTSVYGDSEKTYVLMYSQWSEWTWYDTPATLVQWAINGPLAESGDAGTLSPADLEDSMDENGDYYLLYYDGQIITRKSLINPDLTMIGVGGPRYSNFNFNMIFTVDKSRTVEVNGEQFPYVTFEHINTNYIDEESGAELMIDDCYNCLLAFGFTPGSSKWEDIWEGNDLKDSYYDPTTGVIHFFPMYYFEGAASPYLPKESYVFLPGFADYSMEFSYSGNFVNKAGIESAVINITRSDDVASYVYTCEFGALTDAQVKTVGEELAANTELELSYEVSKDVMFPCAEDGVYTVVAVMYDAKGNNVGVTSYQFEFESVMKESKWESIGMAYFTDDLMTTFFTQYGGDSYEVECEQYKEDPNIFRLVDPLVDWLQNQSFVSTGTPGYIYFDITNPDAVVIIDSPLGFSCPAAFDSDEEVFLVDQGYGMDAASMIACGANGTMEDGVINFPTKFTYNDKQYNLMLLTTASLWQEGYAAPTNNHGMLEIIMPDSFSAEAAAVKAKAKGVRTPKPTAAPQKISKAKRGFLSVAKRKAQKAERMAAELKEFRNNQKISKL